MKVLIYGHSQSQPTGMGDDLVKALKQQKIENKRLGLQGRSDKGLLAESGKLGDVSSFDKVVLYCAGNNSVVSDTIKLITFFGKDRVTVVLPPINVDRVVPGVTLDQRRINANQYRDAISSMVPVFQIEGTTKDFKPDEIHMRAGTAVGKAFAQKLLAHLLGQTPPADTGKPEQPPVVASGKSSYLPLLLIPAAALGALLLLRRR